MAGAGLIATAGAAIVAAGIAVVGFITGGGSTGGGSGGGPGTPLPGPGTDAGHDIPVVLAQDEEEDGPNEDGAVE